MDLMNLNISRSINIIFTILIAIFFIGSLFLPIGIIGLILSNGIWMIISSIILIICGFYSIYALSKILEMKKQFEDMNNIIKGISLFEEEENESR